MARPKDKPKDKYEKLIEQVANEYLEDKRQGHYMNEWKKANLIGQFQKALNFKGKGGTLRVKFKKGGQNGNSTNKS